MSYLNDLYNQYKSKINFYTIYISEAHANDEWPIRIKKELQCNQHKNNLERWNACVKFINDYNYEIPCFIDSISNEFQQKYAAWPARAFLINSKNNKIEWILNPRNPGYFNFKDVKFAIENYLK